MAGRAGRADGEYLGQPFGVDLGRKIRMGENRLRLGAEEKKLAHVGIEQRLDAEPVADEEQLLLRLVPDGEGEDAVEPVHAGLAPLDISLQQHLGVAGRAEAVAAGEQLLF